MSRLEDATVKVSTYGIRRSVSRHLDGVAGLGNVPRSGPVIVVPNHSSYYDHFLVKTVLEAYREEPVWFLTKAEAFEQRLQRYWNHAMGAIPVHRDRPQRDLLTRVDEVLDAGHALCVYPEGTRGPGWPLLPFKEGAFTMAARAGVPVVPVGISGAARILPKGSRWPTSASARVVFGSPLSCGDPAAPRRERVRALRAEAERVVPGLVRDADNLSPDRAAADVAAVVGDAVEALLESSEGVAPATAARLLRLVELAAGGRPAAGPLAMPWARLTGVLALSANPVSKAVTARRLLVLLGELVSQSPADPMALYLLARCHQLAPAALGGNRTNAVDLLRRAAEHAPEGDTRYAAALAEAYHDAGRIGPAREVAAAAIVTTPTTERGHRRIRRLESLLAATGPTAPATSPAAAPGSIHEQPILTGEAR